MKINNLYIGEQDSVFSIYIDPIDFNIERLFNNVIDIQCNSVFFYGLNSKEIANQNLTMNAFQDLLAINHTISEFDMILNHTIHIQNIWWNDLLIISDFESVNSFLNVNKANFASSYDLIMDKMKKATNTLLTQYEGEITETPMNPADFLSYMKNSDRYLDKEIKFLHNLENFPMDEL
jgi:hypothetical protein